MIIDVFSSRREYSIGRYWLNIMPTNDFDVWVWDYNTKKLYIVREETFDLYGGRL